MKKEDIKKEAMVWVNKQVTTFANDAFEAGAEWMEQMLIDKACSEFRKFLEMRMNSDQETNNEMIYRECNAWVGDFRKQMGN